MKRKKSSRGLRHSILDEVDAIFAPQTGPGFISKHCFGKGDLSRGLPTIEWFAKCGTSLKIDLTMPSQQASHWSEAAKACKSASWDKAKNEAWNQLTVWLSKNDPEGDQRWNELRGIHDSSIVDPLITTKIIPFQQALGLTDEFVDSVRQDIRLMLMEDAYIGNGHRCFFFHELLLAYQAGHFPCGWKGKWPQGSLLVF